MACFVVSVVYCISVLPDFIFSCLLTNTRSVCLCARACACGRVLMHVTLHSNNIFSFFILEYLGSFSFSSFYTQVWEQLTLLSFIAKNISATWRSLLSRILITSSCRIFSKCNKVADKNLTQLKAFEKYIYIWVFSLLLEENILITYMWLNMSHYTE